MTPQPVISNQFTTLQYSRPKSARRVRARTRGAKLGVCLAFDVCPRFGAFVVSPSNCKHLRATANAPNLRTSARFTPAPRQT